MELHYPLFGVILRLKPVHLAGALYYVHGIAGTVLFYRPPPRDVSVDDRRPSGPVKGCRHALRRCLRRRFEARPHLALKPVAVEPAAYAYLLFVGRGLKILDYIIVVRRSDAVLAPKALGKRRILWIVKRQRLCTVRERCLDLRLHGINSAYAHTRVVI